MLTLNKIVATVKNMSSGGITPVDFPFRDAQIAHIVDSVADSLRITDINYKGFIDDSNVQDLGCVPLHQVDAADCDNVILGQDVKVAYIPSTLQLERVSAIKFFGFLDKVRVIPMYDTDIVPLNPYIMFPGKTGVSASQIGNKIYVRGANALNLCYVNIRGAFQMPSTVEHYPTQSGDAVCYDWDSEYPLGTHLLESHTYKGQPFAGLYEMVLLQMGYALKKADEQAEKTATVPV